jgi:hypothetical protein
LLTVGVIHPSTNPYYSPIVMVLKKEGTWRMCPTFQALRKFTVKYMFPILIIDGLFHELKGDELFSKLNLLLGYHQIRMKGAYIPKTIFFTLEIH